MSEQENSWHALVKRKDKQIDELQEKNEVLMETLVKKEKENTELKEKITQIGKKIR